MRILGIECSAAAASAAVLEGDKLLGEFFVNIKTTHSQTLLPMTESLVRQLGLQLRDIDLFAVSHGPGSFTGLRIGINAVKGMAYALQKSVMGVSTLAAAAYGAGEVPGVICAAMDARCNQVYTALFEAQERKLLRLTEDAALSIADLEQRLKTLKKPVYLVGDGAQLCFEALQHELDVYPVSPPVRFQRAAGVCLAAYHRILQGENGCDAGALVPQYLRLPQAERERLAKQEAAKVQAL